MSLNNSNGHDQLICVTILHDRMPMDAFVATHTGDMVLQVVVAKLIAGMITTTNVAAIMKTVFIHPVFIKVIIYWNILQPNM